MSDSPMDLSASKVKTQPGPSKRSIDEDQDIIINEPKRPLTSFMIFLKSYRTAWEKTRNNVPSNIMHDCSQLWHKLSAEAKQPYYDLAKRDTERYDEEMKYFLSAGGVPKKKKKVDTNAPKRPMSKFERFYKDVRLVIKAQFPLLKEVDVKKEASRRWGSLDRVQKSRYEEIHVEDKKRYAQEKQAYKRQQQISANRVEEPSQMRTIGERSVEDNNVDFVFGL